ncbi:MAG: hypothetical protein J6J36_02300 [Clostridia bacterium]|nr:hypothetical protein [Clostridia bacterium]
MNKPGIDKETKKIISEGVDVHTRMEETSKEIEKLERRVNQAIKKVDDELDR